MATPTPIKLEDRGTTWIVTYDDGGYDTIPKDPNVLDTAAASVAANGQNELAAKFRMWAANIRAKGVPVIIPSGTTTILVIGAGALLLAYLAFKGKR